MSTTAQSSPNIALIKYWGNRNDELRLPCNDSLAMTLDHPVIRSTIDHADEIAVESITMNQPKEINEKTLSRFAKHIELTKHYLEKLGFPNALPASLSIKIESDIPPAIGLASSSAVFSAMAKAISGLIADEIILTPEQESVIARLGSGSACRGLFDGYSAIRAGEGDAIDAAVGWQVAGPDHWLLHDIIIVPSQDEKKVGSTEGHPTAHTSPHYLARVEAIQTRRQQECIDAILEKDFEKLQAVSEEDCMDMHEKIMQQSTPPLQYLNDETYRIIGEITELRDAEHLPVLYTMDAGPTVHLFCTDESVERIRQYAKEQEGCTVFETKVGKGAKLCM